MFSKRNTLSARRGRILAGTPIATQFGGTSCSTTAFAPIMASSPTVIEPRIGSGSNIHTVSDLRRAGYPGAPQADGDSISDNHLVAQCGITAHYDSSEMVDSATSAQPSFAGKFDSRDYLDELEQELVQK